ncbi:ATP-binding cassette domain-containing protein, partial [Staphylococcus pasteuri]|uniref:ATP-binding cassette domain-containing protein n=1 Tax=Staphylococcus pasteuri TaxID=45972 RepID=UPI0030C5C605
ILLQGNGIARTFGGDVLFENINFSLQDHSRIALVGRNGAGKSTFIKAIVGMQKLDSGTVKILERKIPDREVLGKLGY